MDERNFHCWNYRLWVVGVYLAKIEQMSEGREEYTAFLKNECDMAEKMIKKNFSNFSAWHYRSKLMPKIYERQEGLAYILPVERITQDMEMLKHAFFTDPNDQSPWNYHEWLISLVTPIQIVALNVLPEQNSIQVGLS
jgi:geranylgeranyl transferase type-2 subunit alpha